MHASRLYPKKVTRGGAEILLFCFEPGVLFWGEGDVLKLRAFVPSG
jgi:hypothetical protein